ncbi:hypothetical protein [Agrobacterium larrymoorei]|uniref:hypothetical protein n=1 Tax=Agrobacterium larrymoorei TaxID=160699 RepID=UPI0030C0F969
MEFVLGIALGLSAAATRSTFAVAMVGILVVAVFASAALMAASGVSLLTLLVTLAGLNIGVAMAFFGAFAFR